MPDIPGIELGIDSNGFFDLESIPKKCAVVGSGYIAVELAGILQLLGSEVDLLIRGERPLRTMEADIVDLLVDEMGHAGVNWVNNAEVAALSGTADGPKTITTKGGETLEGYDEVLFAIGRTPVTESLNLEAAGVETTARQEVVVDATSKTTAEDVYAVGDIITGAVQLTPVAIAAGRLLSDRLFNGVPVEETTMDYDQVCASAEGAPRMSPEKCSTGWLRLPDGAHRCPLSPTAPLTTSSTAPLAVFHRYWPFSTAPLALLRFSAHHSPPPRSASPWQIPTVVFSHPTLAVMGPTEEEAIAKYGADQVTCHKTTFVNMLYSREFLVEGQAQPKTRAKLVCVGEEQTVVGLHMIGLATDEILQGFGVAMKMGATKADFDSVVAIHPTSAEELVTIPPWQAKYGKVGAPKVAVGA